MKVSAAMPRARRQRTTKDNDKGKEGKCGEGKCGGAEQSPTALAADFQSDIHGAGLGLRRAFLTILPSDLPSRPTFSKSHQKIDSRQREIRRPTWTKRGSPADGMSWPVTHLGGQAALDIDLVNEIGRFLQQYRAVCYSEHLSYCGDSGHLYDLLPLPFTQQAVEHVSDRIKQVQDVLGQQIAVENVSYYCAPSQQMPEIEFLLDVLTRADCALLLDVNNVYVNSINHGYDADQFLQQLPAERIAYGHIAGHYQEHEDLLVDTHGSDVIDPVWTLLADAYEIHGVFPTLLERDFNIPALQRLEQELGTGSSVFNNNTRLPCHLQENGRFWALERYAEQHSNTLYALPS